MKTLVSVTRHKLLAAIPSISRRNAEYVRQRIYIDATSWHAAEHDDLSSLSRLQEALWRERKLLITYQRSDTVAVERLVDPLGLVAKGSTWYLVAAINQEIRTYRVSRIMCTSLQEQESERPTDFDLAAYWTQSSARFVAAMPRYPVMVRVVPDVLERIAHAGRYARIEHMHAPDAEGWIELSLCFEMEEAACGYLLSFGVQVEILEPLALRAKVVTLAQNMAAFYANTLPNLKK